MSETQSYNNVSFEHWPFIYWYEVNGTINSLKQPKHTLQLNLPNFKKIKLQVFRLPA